MSAASVSAAATSLPGQVRQADSGTTFGGLACISASSCVAAGTQYVDSGGTQKQYGAIIPISNGVPGSPEDTPDDINGLGAIGCTAKGLCVASGYGFVTQPAGPYLVSVDNGAITGETAGGPSLGFTGISCPGTTECVGVGYTTDPSGNPTGEIASIDPVSRAVSVLATPTAAWTALGCTGKQPGGDPPVCVAVGTTSRSAGSQLSDNVLEIISGAIAYGPYPAPSSWAPSEYDPLTDVSCPDDNNCVVAAGEVIGGGMGAYFDVSLSVIGTGSKEKIKEIASALQAVTGIKEVRAVACGSAASCILGGSIGGSYSIGTEGALVPVDPASGQVGAVMGISGMSQIAEGFVSPSLIVNTTNDSGSGGACATSTADCSLRGAIKALNDGAKGKEVFIDGNYPQSDVYSASIPDSSVAFNISASSGMPKIDLKSPLPVLTKSANIDGTSEPGASPNAPGVEVDGSHLTGTSVDGLVVKGGSSLVKGLALTGFSGAGISLQGAGGDEISTCWLGVGESSSGTPVAAGNHDGVVVASPSAVLDSDVMSANGDHKGLATFKGDPKDTAAGAKALSKLGAGVLVSSSAGADLVIRSDVIGLSPTGDEGSESGGGLGAFANPTGIALVPDSGNLSDVVVGGGAGDGNVISGNAFGLFAEPTAAGASIGSLFVTGNAIGTSLDGKGGAGSGLQGVGILAAGDKADSIPGLQMTGNTIDDSVLGIALLGPASKGAVVEGNAIGQANSQDFLGVMSESVDDVQIGSTSPSSGNSVRSEVGGIVVDGGNGDQIVGNTIGSTTATSPGGSGTFGILARQTKNISIGAASAGNVVNGEAISVILMATPGAALASDQMTNGVIGLWLDGDSGVTVGGSAERAVTMARNLIGFLVDDGVPSSVEAKDLGTSDKALNHETAFDTPSTAPSIDRVEGAAPLSGFFTVPKLLSDPSSRLVFSNDVIGGTTAGDGNTIAGLIAGDTSSISFTANTVTGSKASGILVGPSVPGRVETGISLQSNMIWNNETDPSGVGELRGKGLGFDLVQVVGSQTPVFGPTKNHHGGSITGPNFFQDFPVFSAAPSGGQVQVSGTVEGDPNASITVQIFSNARCNASGFGEGQTLVGTVQVTTGSNGMANFSDLVSVATSLFLTTNATEWHSGTIGDTSEFSACEPA